MQKERGAIEHKRPASHVTEEQVQCMGGLECDSVSGQPDDSLSPSGVGNANVLLLTAVGFAFVRVLWRQKHMRQAQERHLELPVWSDCSSQGT